MRGDGVVSEALREQVRHALRHAARVDKDDGRPVLAHVRGDAIENVGHLLARRHRTELLFRQLNGKIEITLMPDVDDGAPGYFCRWKGRLRGTRRRDAFG